MKTSRLGRDLLMLTGFCGAFALLLYLTGGFSNDDKDGVDFSFNRVQADRSLRNRDWDAAELSLQKLIEADPFDGRAQFRYAELLFKRRWMAAESLAELSDADRQGPPGQRLIDIRDQFTDRAIDELNRAKAHLRFRGKSLLYLAGIECDRRDDEAALDYLEEFVDNGHTTEHGLQDYLAFGTETEAQSEEILLGIRPVSPTTRLHQYERFWRIVKQERALRGGL